jgi:pimeloyl-ACP methyl ester carboxylesterase
MRDTPPTTTWVLLRGLTRCSTHWGDFPQALAQALPGARVVLLDLPGNGTLYQQPSPTSIAALVAFCRAELRRQGVVAPFHLLAMSMGAMVAAQWAHEAPEDLAGAVLINTSFRPFSPFFQRLRPRNYARLLRVALPGASVDARERMVLRLTSNHPGLHASALARWQQIRQQHPVSTGNALRQLWAAARFRASPQAPACPVLLLGSAHDGLVNAQCTHSIAQQWQAPKALHPDAGHDLPLDDPQWVIDQVRQWLAQRAGA